ncbi:MAG: branched-chain amino acid ABC transporter permease [Acetobacteraceae bacterium]
MSGPFPVAVRGLAGITVLRSPARHLLKYLLMWAVLLVLPMAIGSGPTLQTVNLVCIYAIAALGLNIIFGLGGLLSIAQAAIMGVGAYVLAYAMRGALEAAPAMILACIASAAVSGFIGLASARTRSHYFIVLTVAVAEAATVLVQNNPDITGGANGMPVTGSTVIAGQNLTTADGLYFCAMPLLLASWYLADCFKRSRPGIALRALAVDEHLAIVAGVATGPARFAANFIGGGFAGLAGALLALGDAYIGPQDFGLDTAALLLLITVLGGPGSNAGTVVATIILTFLLQGTLTFTVVGQLIYGIAIVVLVVVAPGGLAGLAELIRRKLRGPRDSVTPCGGPRP